MSEDESSRRPREHPARSREDYARGLPDHHDPFAGIGGAPPALSPLTARLVFATFGFVVALAGAVGCAVVAAPVGFVVVLAVLAAATLVDIAVIVRRKRRGEPG